MTFEQLQKTPPIIKEFLSYMQTVKGKSPKTIDEYYLDLRTFFRYLKLSWELVPSPINFEEISIDDIDLDMVKKITLLDVYSFLSYCQSDRKNNAKTRLSSGMEG